jgi:hypothetical protein
MTCVSSIASTISLIYIAQTYNSRDKARNRLIGRELEKLFAGCSKLRLVRARTATLVAVSPHSSRSGQFKRHTTSAILESVMETKVITVLITAASSGIGETAARLFTKEGFRVFGKAM